MALTGWLAGLAAGYVLGALPVGMLVARVAGGPDLRETGSGRTGAANALRALGLRWAGLVLVLDLGKGAGAVLLGAAIGGAAGLPPDWLAAAAGLAAVLGHTRSVFMGFRGGRGVATSAGGLLVMVPLALLPAALLAALVIARTRYVSLGSLAGMAAAPLTAFGLRLAGQASDAGLVLAVGAGVLVAVAHADNITRLRSGTERRIGASGP